MYPLPLQARHHTIFHLFFAFFVLILAFFTDY
jgi:hypothetical protein